MQKHVNLVDLVKSFPTNIFLQKLASIHKRTSPLKFAHLAEKSEIAVRYRTFQLSSGREGHGELVGARDVVRDGFPLVDLFLFVHNRSAHLEDASARSKLN